MNADELGVVVFYVVRLAFSAMLGLTKLAAI
jgi:hypothetical protein